MSTAKAQPQKAPRKEAAPKSRREPSAIQRSSELSAEVLEQLETGQRGAITAVRRFIDSTDSALPSLGSGPSRAQEIVDSALEMSERLVEVQYELLRSVVRSTGETVSGPSGTR